MFIDCSKLPDPLSPLEDDVYTSLDGAHTLVVTNSPLPSELVRTARALRAAAQVIPVEGESRPPSAVIGFVLNGLPNACPQGHLPSILTSIGARPWGRLDRSAATRPEITTDPELVKDRLVALGPHLRALREQYGLSMGDLARALGCPRARLSMLELATPDPVRESTGVREDEGRAALAELLTETVVVALKRACPRQSAASIDTFRAMVWPEIAGMLETAPALAAMDTIHNATAEPPKGTGAWHQPPPKPGPGSVFQPGDRITYKGKAATVREVDHEHFAMLVTFESGETSAVPTNEAKLANENVATQTARAGLALLLASDLARARCNLDKIDIDDLRAHVDSRLATDEAQRLIRLHG